MNNIELYEAVENGFPAEPLNNPEPGTYLEMQEAHLVKVFPSAQDIFDRYFGADETGDDRGMEHAVVFTEDRGENIVYKIKRFSAMPFPRAASRWWSTNSGSSSAGTSRVTTSSQTCW